MKNIEPQTFNHVHTYTQNQLANRLALVGFIFAFIISVIGLVLSIVALRKVRYTNEGKSLALAGIMISSIGIGFMITLILLIVIVVNTSPLY